MGTDSSDLSIDIHIADALRHAMLLYGDDVLEHPELVDILADHGAFKDRIGVDGIIQMLVDNGRIPSLLPLSYKNSAEIISGVDKVVCELKYESSLSEMEIRRVILSMMKGMNMSLDIHSDRQPDPDLPDVTEIAPGFTDSPSCCAVKPKKTVAQRSSEPDMEEFVVNTSAEKGNAKRNKPKKYVLLLGISVFIAAGLFAAVNFSESQREEDTSHSSESVADRLYREILEDIHSNSGRLSPSGRDKLDRALAEFPDDYWLNLLKDKTK